jgi:glycosyltransferase involved in cell wall biosynthesis
MNVTILTQYYPPEVGAPQRRLSDLARRLIDRGHSVQVLTALPNYPGDHVFPEFAHSRNSVVWQDGVRIARVALFVPPLKKTLVDRLRCYFSFAFNVARFGKRLLEPTDVIFMESPPLTLAPAGVLLARSLRVPLVSNISDLWPQSAVELGMLGPGFMLRCAEWLERWTYKSSAALTGQTEGICDQLRAVESRKPIYFFPNGVDLDAYAKPTDVESTRQRFGWRSDEFVAGYTGLLGHAQALGQVIDAARRLRAEDKIRVVVFGDGPCREELEAIVKAGPPMPWLTIFPGQPAAAMPAIQAALDAGIVPLADKPIFAGARPSKMLEIMAAGRAVVFCGRGETERLLNRAPGGPAGVVVAPENPEELARELIALASNRKRCEEMGRSGRAMIVRDFDRRQIAIGLESFLTQVILAPQGADGG